jgi:hypothetical protein
MLYKCDCHSQHDMICTIFQQMAREKNKSEKRIMDLFFLEENGGVIRHFWDILDKKIPDHSYTGIGCCPCCGEFYLD